MKRQLFALTLVVFMLIGSLPVYAAEVTGSGAEWSDEAVAAISAMGILDGLAKDEYAPDEDATRGDIFKMMNNVMRYQKASSKSFSDLPETHVHYETMLKMVEAGIVLGYEDGTMRPDATITRDEAVVLFARVFGIGEDIGAAMEFDDSDTIDDWAKPLVGGMKRAGYIQGYKNLFAPKSNLTIAEVATLISNLVSAIINEPGIYTPDDVDEIPGNLVINAKGVVLDGVTVKGNLYLAPGVGDGNVTLNKVEVNETLYVFGGGKDTVTISGNGTDIKDIYVKKDSATGTVRVYNATGKSIDVCVDDGSADVILVGAFGTVEVLSPGITVTVVNAATGGVTTQTTIAALNIFANDVTTNIGARVKIAKLVVDADESKVEGTGTVTEAAFIGGVRGVITVPGTRVTVGKDAGSVKAGNVTVQPGGTYTIPSSSGGGGGGSGSGGSGNDGNSEDGDKDGDKTDNTIVWGADWAIQFAGTGDFAIGGTVTESVIVTVFGELQAVAGLDIGGDTGTDGIWAVKDEPVITYTLTPEDGFVFVDDDENTFTDTVAASISAVDSAEAEVEAEFNVVINGDGELVITVTYPMFVEMLYEWEEGWSNIIITQTGAELNAPVSAVKIKVSFPGELLEIIDYSAAFDVLILEGESGTVPDAYYTWGIGDVPVVEVTLRPKEGYAFAPRYSNDEPGLAEIIRDKITAPAANGETQIVTEPHVEGGEEIEGEIIGGTVTHITITVTYPTIAYRRWHR